MRAQPRGFTLLELLVAVFVLGALTVAVSGVLGTTLRSRDNAAGRLDGAHLRAGVMRTLGGDLTQMVQPGGLLAGAVLGERDESGGQRADQLEFYTTSGRVAPRAPWGDVQRVVYYLTDELDDRPGTPCLVREVTRNLLPTVEENPEVTVLLEQVISLTFLYYDGESWQESWDSTVLDDAAPQGVQVRVEYERPDREGVAAPPVDAVFEVAARKVDTEPSGDDSAGGGG
jgi:type II secretion system protein J